MLAPLQPTLISLPKLNDDRGSLTFLEGGRHIPFEIRRIYYLYDVPAGASRGGHGHKALQQVLIAISGRFEVVVRDGRRELSYSLDRPDSGLYLPRMMWRELREFAPGSVCMVLASDNYDESDYFRDYSDFIRAVNEARL